MTPSPTPAGSPIGHRKSPLRIVRPSRTHHLDGDRLHVFPERETDDRPAVQAASAKPFEAPGAPEPLVLARETDAQRTALTDEVARLAAEADPGAFFPDDAPLDKDASS